MFDSSTVQAGEARYELRFTGLLGRARGYSFPCDAMGRVCMDELSDRALVDYLFARAAVGAELRAPVVSPVP